MTKTLLFAGEGSGGQPVFHAYDKATGADIWQTPIPGPQTSLPMTYVHQGRQFVVVGVRGDAARQSGAQLVAFALPRPAPAGGAPRRSWPRRWSGGRTGAASGDLQRTYVQRARSKAPPDKQMGKTLLAVACRACMIGATGARAAARDRRGHRGRRPRLPRRVRELPRAGRQPGARRRSRPRSVQARADRRGSDRHHPEGHPQHADAGHQHVSDEQAARVVAYLRSVAASRRSGTAAGDAARGKALFDGKGACATCHRVGAVGSRVGPGPERHRPAAPRRWSSNSRCVDPDADVQATNRSYRVVAKDGTATTGRLLNLDSFTVQLLDTKEQLRSFVKSDLRELRLRPVADAVVQDAAQRAGARRRRQLSRVAEGAGPPHDGARLLAFVVLPPARRCRRRSRSTASCTPTRSRRTG